jgi:hypothetical protein
MLIATVLSRAVLCCAVFAAPAAAQVPDTAGVRQAVLDYVNGFYEGDTTLFIRSIRPEVSKFGFWRPADSTRYQGDRMQWPDFHAFANRVKRSGRPAPATAPKEIRLLDVQDQTAAAKLTAWWGTDYLLLGKFDGRWMITHVLWQSLPPKASPPAR